MNTLRPQIESFLASLYVGSCSIRNLFTFENDIKSSPNLVTVIISVFILLSQSLSPVPYSSILIDENIQYIVEESDCSMLGLEFNDEFSFESYVSAEKFLLGPDYHDFTLIIIQRENLSADLWMTDGVEMNLLVDGISSNEYYEGYNMSDFNESSSIPTINAVEVIGTLDGDVIFSVRKLTDTELWITDGTSEGTNMFFSENLNNSIIRGGNQYEEYSLEFDGFLYFGEMYDYTQLWRTDGTAEGTEVVSLGDPHSEHRRIKDFRKTSQGLVFTQGQYMWFVNHTFNPVSLEKPYWLNFEYDANWDLVEINSQFYLFDGNQFMSTSDSIFNIKDNSIRLSLSGIESVVVINDNIYTVEKQCYDSEGNLKSGCNDWPGQDMFDATFSIELWRNSATGDNWNVPELVSNITQYIDDNWDLTGLNNYPHQFTVSKSESPYDNTQILGYIIVEQKRYYFYADSKILDNTTSSLEDDTSHLWGHFVQNRRTGMGDISNEYHQNLRAPYLTVIDTYGGSNNIPYVLDGYAKSSVPYTFTSMTSPYYDDGLSINPSIYSHSVIVNNRILLFAYDWHHGMSRNITGNVTVLALDYWDLDQDGICNYNDPDDDNDGWGDSDDDFPRNPEEYSDTDWDGIGDNEDTDDDADGYNDSVDAFPLINSEWNDTDGDGTGDNNDGDDDNDGWSDWNEEECETDPLDVYSIPLDTDEDMICNKFDNNDDGDSLNDTLDIFPLDPTEWEDNDEDGIGDNADKDDDNDGWDDIMDSFPLDNTEWSDFDLDGMGDNIDPDDDNDGINDQVDAYPLDANRYLPESKDNDNFNNLMIPILLVVISVLLIVIVISIRGNRKKNISSDSQSKESADINNLIESYVKQMVASGYDENAARQYAEQFYSSHSNSSK